jgi:mRNA interferase MazF
MKRPGQIVLFNFPQTDLRQGKPRPALIIGKLPGEYDDWLICMISTRIHQTISGFDELILKTDKDYEGTGLKEPSVIRVGRLAVVDGGVLLGLIGVIEKNRLNKVKRQLADWILRS